MAKNNDFNKWTSADPINRSPEKLAKRYDVTARTIYRWNNGESCPRLIGLLKMIERDSKGAVPILGWFK